MLYNISLLLIDFIHSSVHFSRSVMSDSLRPHESQHARPPCPSPTPGVYPNPCPCVNDAIQTSHALSSPSPPALNLSQNQGLFQSGGQSIGVSASTSVLPMNTQDWPPLGRTGWISWQSLQDSQKSSPTPQFKSINYLALSLLYGSALRSVHNYRKSHSFD